MRRSLGSRELSRQHSLSGYSILTRARRRSFALGTNRTHHYVLKQPRAHDRGGLLGQDAALLLLLVPMYVMADRWQSAAGIVAEITLVA